MGRCTETAEGDAVLVAKTVFLSWGAFGAKVILKWKFTFSSKKVIQCAICHLCGQLHKKKSRDHKRTLMQAHAESKNKPRMPPL